MFALDERNEKEEDMRMHMARQLAAISCAALIGVCSLYAEGPLTIKSPLDLQVTQRTEQNQAEVTIAGVAGDTVDVIEAKAELAAGATHGKAVDWTTISKGPDMAEGKFSGKLLITAGGWYTGTPSPFVHVQAKTSLARSRL